MIDRGLVTRQEILEYFDAIRPHLYRFPAVDPATFDQSVRTVAAI